jgi:hypothetical protein
MDVYTTYVSGVVEKVLYQSIDIGQAALHLVT